MPTGNQMINDRFTTGQPNYREFFYTLVNFAGGSQNFDGNGSYLRAPARAAATSLVERDRTRRQPQHGQDSSGPTRSRRRSGPSRSSAAGPPKKPEVRC